MKPYRNPHLVKIGRVHKIAAEMTNATRFTVHVELPPGAYVGPKGLEMPDDKRKIWTDLGLLPLEG